MALLFDYYKYQLKERTFSYSQGPLLRVIPYSAIAITLGKITMCSFSAKSDLDAGKEDVNARNPVDPEPCVAK